MMRGEFRDEVRDEVRDGLRADLRDDGRLVHDSGWRCNAIVATAWPLVAGLLRGEPGVAGIQFLAVGEGDPAWDGAHVPADPGTTRLRAEVARVDLRARGLAYLDPRGRPTRTPTA